MDIAVMLTGHLRTFRETWQSWSELRENHDVHFHVRIWDHSTTKHRSWWHGNRDVPMLTQEDINDALKFYTPVVFTVIDYEEPVDRPEYAPYVNSRVQASQIEQQWGMIKECFNGIRDQYDLIIRARPDIICQYVETDLDVFDITTTDKASDAFFAGTYAAMSEIMSIQFPDALMNMPKDLVPEEMFLRHCKNRDLFVESQHSATILRENGEKIHI